MDFEEPPGGALAVLALFSSDENSATPAHGARGLQLERDGCGHFSAWLAFMTLPQYLPAKHHDHEQPNSQANVNRAADAVTEPKMGDTSLDGLLQKIWVMP